MDNHGIVVDSVWKKFHRGELHDSLRDLLPAVAKRLVGRAPGRKNLGEGDFWALKEVSFKVKPGEALGIIGPNGAGKSTLLKVLSRILRPNRGAVEVRGRVGALIEIAAGFHPDLTGRENIYLQGAIMGMKRTEIARKFDEIVEFSGVPEFIDTPVKRYSSGMNARLGFSIAAHLNPDVLLVDEVLAVGDLIFQKKAFAKLREVLSGDIAVVVVSHQLNRIAELCTQALLLKHGTIAHAGPPSECIAEYLKANESSKSLRVGNNTPIAISSFQPLSTKPVCSGDFLEFEIGASIVSPAEASNAGISLRLRAHDDNDILFATGPRLNGIDLPSGGDFALRVELQMNVAPGLYIVEALIWDSKKNRPASHGPKVVIEVREGAPFVGRIQMNSKMRLVDRVGARTETK